MNILHRRNLGFIYDLTQIVMCKTARRESWINVFVRGGHEAEDLRDLEQILGRFNDVDPSLLLFGYRDRKKGSLIGNIFGEFANEKMPKCEMDDFVTYLSDIERVKVSISKYYFDSKEMDDIYRKIASEKELAAEVKSLLYEFYLFPEQFMKVVIAEMNKIALTLQKYHTENLETLLSCQEAFDYTALEKENSPFAKNKKWEQGVKNCYVSFALFGKFACLRGKCDGNGWLVLGCEIQNTFDEAIEPEIDIAGFGNAFGDKLRVKIVDEIVKHGELTLAELAKKLGVVNTIAIYHLDILKKEKLILHRHHGRKVLYCLNKAQINKGLDAMIKLCGGEKQ